MAEEAPMAPWRRDWETGGFSSCLRLSTGVLQLGGVVRVWRPQPPALRPLGAWVGQAHWARLTSCLELLVQSPTPPAVAGSQIN